MLSPCNDESLDSIAPVGTSNILLSCPAVSSLVYCAYLHKLLVAGQIDRLLLVPTGALLSKDSSLQGENIPGIAYAVAIECR